MKALIFSFLIFISGQSICQNVEIQGSAKISQMSDDNQAEKLVVRQADGTLATRSASSLPPNNPIDTSRNLASDFELFSHICDCGPILPPLMIQTLLESGYTVEDLINLGVPYDNIHNGLKIEDADGNEYTPVTIGSQTWLKENLKTTKYNNGMDIPYAASDLDWNDKAIYSNPAYCWTGNNIMYKEEYGAFYNWYAISSTSNGGNEVCPLGYHIPSLGEYNTLKLFLVSSEGGKLKEAGFSHWIINEGGTNSSGFTALPGGLRSASGTIIPIGNDCHLWNSDDLLTSGGRSFIPGNSIEFYAGANQDKGYGHNVRCIKD